MKKAVSTYTYNATNQRLAMTEGQAGVFGPGIHFS